MLFREKGGDPFIRSKKEENPTYVGFIFDKEQHNELCCSILQVETDRASSTVH